VKTLVLASALFLSAALLHATAGKDNTGTVIQDLKVRFSGKAPELKGRAYILEFWATWCGPCRKSIPHLNEIHRKYKDRGLEIIGVTDEDRQTVRNFTKEVPIEYTVAHDPYGKLGEQFQIEGIPHAMIVDKTGKIVWEGHPSSLPEARLESVLKAD
jgi:cytochrome c biogenesis protein CcmG/thiol:disulfide interchange protein DsbE